MSKFLLDVDVVLDENEDPLGVAERVTLEIPDETLTALVAKSTPPRALVGGEPSIRYRDRISLARAFSLSKRWEDGR